MFQKTLTGGRYNESNYPVQELWRKRGGGRIFEGGVLAGHYGMFLITITVLLSILTRNIRRKHFKDTKKVNAFIYLFIVNSFIGYPLSQFVTNREIQVYLTFFGINSHAILCQMFLFLPKCLPPFLRHLKLKYWKAALKDK